MFVYTILKKEAGTNKVSEVKWRNNAVTVNCIGLANILCKILNQALVIKGIEQQFLRMESGEFSELEWDDMPKMSTDNPNETNGWCGNFFVEEKQKEVPYGEVLITTTVELEFYSNKIQVEV